MDRKTPPHRPAMTAIAAVMVMSAAPLFAQTTDGAASQPVTIAPPAPVVAPAVTTSQAPAAADAPAAVTATAPAPEAAPAPAMRTMSTPVEHVADVSSEPAPRATKVAPRRIATTSAARRVTPASERQAPERQASASPRQQTPVAAPRTSTPVVAPKPDIAAATPAPAKPVQVVAQTRNVSSTTTDETLPIAGGVVLGFLALGGAAFAVRRKRREDEEQIVVREAVAPPLAPADAAPASSFVPSRPAPALAASGNATLPSGFDISRFGRHTQAAYRGPTPDNPSLSLKRRLSRASFFDRRERLAAATTTAPVQPAVPETRATAQTPRTRTDDGQITVRLAPHRSSPRFSYGFQR